MSGHSLETDPEEFIHLYKANLIPLNTVLAALVWVLYDFFMTIEDEVTYIWTQKRGFGKFMYLWIRYYTIFLVAFDTLQIHSFAIPGFVTLELCVLAAPIVRVAGAIGLWSIQLVMQVRIYLIFNRSRKVALLNGVGFSSSIIAFLVIIVINALRRRKAIASIVGLPLKGCPVINGGIEWALWIPAMLFELLLFGFVIYKSIVSATARTRLNERRSLVSVLLHENFIYFLIVTLILFFSNLMVIGATRIPWFGFAPFHAALGITISRMMIHLRKFALNDLGNNQNEKTLPPLRFQEVSSLTNREDIGTTPVLSTQESVSIEPLYPLSSNPISNKANGPYVGCRYP